LTGHTEPVRGLAFGSDHFYLASITFFGELNIWIPSENWSLINRLNYGTNCMALVQLPNAQLAANSFNEINIWSPLTIDTPLRTLTGHSDLIVSLALSPDNKILASGSKDNDIMLWNYTSESTAFMTLAGHEKIVSSLCFISNQILASGSDDKTIKIWNVTSGLKIYILKLLLRIF
jgi:WD40 repeat protein